MFAFLAWTGLSLGWLLNAFGLGWIPFWVVLGGHLVFLYTMPKPVAPAVDDRFPSVGVWLLNGLLMVGSVGGGAVFIIASGLAEGEPVRMNWVAKAALLLIGASMAAPFAAKHLESFDLRRAERKRIVRGRIDRSE